MGGMNLHVVLTFIFPVGKDIKHFYVFIDHCISSYEKCLLISLAHFVLDSLLFSSNLYQWQTRKVWWARQEEARKQANAPSSRTLTR
jgi:hypothetical protein